MNYTLRIGFQQFSNSVIISTQQYSNIFQQYFSSFLILFSVVFQYSFCSFFIIFFRTGRLTTCNFLHCNTRARDSFVILSIFSSFYFIKLISLTSKILVYTCFSRFKDHFHLDPDSSLIFAGREDAALASVRNVCRTHEGGDT